MCVPIDKYLFTSKSPIVIMNSSTARQQHFEKVGVHMTEKEMIQKNIEEFSRLQTYMLATDKNSDGYRLMKDRYTELKVILMAFGINLSEIDKIKE